MKNIYLLFLFYKLYFLLFVKAIYIPYGRLECDILKTIYQVDNYNNFYNNFLKWKKGEDKSNDENDVYINIINKLYKECLVERPLKNIKYERNIKEIFEKEKELREKERNEKLTVNLLSKSTTFYSNKEFKEQLNILNIPFHYNLNQILKWYLPVSYIDFTYEKESSNYIGFLDILQDSLILKKEIKENVFIRQSLCLKKTYEQIYLIYDENELARMNSQKILDLEEEEHRNNKDNSHSQLHLRNNFNRFISNNKDQEWTNKLFKMDDDNIMNWPTKFYNEIIKVFNFSDKNKEEKEKEKYKENVNKEQDEIHSNKNHLEDSKITNNSSTNDNSDNSTNSIINNNNNNDNNNNDNNNDNNNNNNINNNNNSNNKKLNEFNKESTLEKLKEMEDYVHYQEKFSGNACKNEYYYFNNEEYFKRLFDQKLTCSIRLEDKLKIKSNEKNKININNNSNSNNKSNYNNNKNINDNNNNKHVINEVVKERMQTIELLEKIYSQKNEEDDIISTTTIDSSYQESDKEDKSNYSISSSEGPMETPNVIDDKKGNDEDFISSLMEEKVTATTTLFEQSDEKKDHQEKDINVTQTPNNQDHQNSNEETSSFIKDKENIKYEIPTTENEDKVEKEKDTQLVDEVNEEKEEITTGIDIDDKKEKETIENENLNINESEKEYYDNNVENKTNIINNKNETESEKINTQSTSGENEKNSNKSSNSKYKNRFLSYFLRDGQSKVKKPKPIPSMEDDIIYSVKDLKLTGKEHFNFASLDCAAAVLKSNPELKMANAILNESKDSYSNNICQAKEKFVIIELCEDILIDRIILGNFEYFSSMYKDVKVSISSRYPPKDGHWKLLAFLRATNSRDIQVFKIKKPLSYVKYVRFDFLSYYGYEYFCPLSLIRIHGRTMMDEFIEDEGKLEEEVIIETPTYPYLQPGHPFLTLPSSSNSHESSPFEDAFPFLSSDSFLSDTSSNSKVQTNSRVTSHSKSSTSTSSSSTKGDNSDKGSTNINLFSLFVKQYNNQLITNKNDYSYETSPTTRATRQTKTNPSTTTTPNDIEEELTNESNINNSNEEEDDDKVNNDNENQPPLHESVFKTIMRRLTALERNTTLSFKYLEEQGKIFNQYILYLNKKQQTSLKQLIKDNNMMYDNNLHALKNEFDSNWKEMWNELQINKQIYYDTIKQIAFKIENIEQSYDNRMFALLLIIIFNKLIWIIIKKMWSLLFRFSSKSKRRYSNTRIKQKNDYYYLESDDSFSSLNNINTSNYEDFVRRKSPLSNNIKYSSSSPNTPPAKLKRKKMLRKIPSYTNAVHMNRYEHINNHIYGPGTNYAQSIGHIQSRASNSTGSSRRNSSVEFSTNDLLRKSQRLPPQTSTLLSSASSILQAKKLLHTLYHQKPPLSPNSSYSNKKFDSLIDNIDGASSSSTNGTNINNNSNNNNNSLSTNPKLKHHYSSPRSTYLSMPSKDIEKNMKKKEKVKDNSSVSSQSDDNNNNGDDEDDEDEDDVKEIAGTIKESEHKKNKGNYHSHTSAASHCPLGISTQPDTTTDNNNSNSEIEEVKEKKELKDEKGNHSITLSKISNENMPVITTTKVKGIKSNSLPINSYMHSSTHHGQNYNHSGNRVKLTSSPISMATAATTVTSTETPSTSMKNSHRSGVRLPSINTSKLGLPSSSSKSPNASSIINSTPIIDYPVSAPIDTNHPTSTMDSVNTPSSAPLHLHHYDDLSNIYTNMILSSLSSTSKERSRIHRNYNFIGNKHILRRKRTNLVRSPASFPSLNINRMNNK